jgi:hypothetical protein
MTIRARITCITKTDRWNPHERISHVGGTNGDGKRWLLTQADAIEGIKLRKYDFFVERPQGHVADVIVARSALGHDYLKTKNDGEQPDNLLSLAQCPL